MRLIFLTSFLVLSFIAPCRTHGAHAEPPGTGRAPSAVHAVLAPGAMLVMDGKRIIARLTDQHSTYYFYRSGRLYKIKHADGMVANYYYEGGRLDRIEFSDGQVQKAVYRAGVLASMESSSGQRLVLVPGEDGDDKMVASAAGEEGPGMSSGSSVSPGRGAAAPDPHALNRQLIAILGWEDNSWECRLAPDEQTICIGRGEGGGTGAGDPYGGREWTPGDGAPAEGGGGGGGGGIPDSYPTNLPTRISCLAAATRTFEIMRDQLCSMVRDKDVCMAQAQALFEAQWQECIATFPAAQP